MKNRIVTSLLMLIFTASLMVMGCDGQNAPLAETGTPEAAAPTDQTQSGVLTEDGTKDTTPPSVTAADPALNATGVALNAGISVTFSEPMKPETINRDTFKLTLNILNDNGTPVEAASGVVSYNGVTATFKPDADLWHGKQYTISVVKDVADLAGNTMQSAFASTFTTGSTADSTPPTVRSTAPATGATNIAPSDPIIVVFSEVMDSNTIIPDAFNLSLSSDGTQKINCTVSYAGLTATITPARAMTNMASYKLTIAGTVTDLAGNRMANDYRMQFQTGTAPDTTKPTYVSWAPIADETNVLPTTKIQVIFSEAMALSNASTHSIILRTGEAQPVEGTYTYLNNTLTFTPSAPLAETTVYIYTVVKDNVADLAGNHPDNDLLVKFTTGAKPVDTTPPTITKTIPSNNATNIPVFMLPKIQFSEAITFSDSNTFILKNISTNTQVGVTSIAKNNIATITPSSPLDANTIYTIAIDPKKIFDLAGNMMKVEAQTISFTTAPDTTTPTILKVLPEAGPVPSNTKFVVIFSEVMKESSINNVLLVTPPDAYGLASSLPIDVQYFNDKIVIVPTTTKTLSGPHILKVKKSITDLGGNQLASEGQYSYTFTSADDSRPTIDAIYPYNGYTNISLETTINIAFSEELNPATISSDALQLSKIPAAGNPELIEGSFQYNGKEITFKPFRSLSPNTTYRFITNTNIEDLSGNPLELKAGSPFDGTIQFTTAAQ